MPARSGTSSSSMNTAGSFGSSWLEGSPSRQSPLRSSIRTTPRASPVRVSYESPSRKLQDEFNQMLGRSDREFNERLDQDAARRASIHHEQLTKAAQEHQRVLEGARLELERISLEHEQEKQRREEAQRREIERLKQEKAREEAEIQRQRLEASKREEEAVRHAEERQKQIQAAEARAQAQREQEEAARRQREEAERKAKEVAAAAIKAPLQAPAPPVVQAPSAPTVVQPAAPVTSAPGVEELHNQYLQLHTRMKQFRQRFVAEHKVKGDPLKAHVGDIRRDMRKRLGQVTVDRKDSQAAIKAIRAECFGKALNTPGPMVDIRQYIVSHQLPAVSHESEYQYPALLLYTWVCFEKSVIKQWHQEAAQEEAKVIQELGLIAASLYADVTYMWKGALPFTDTILAKLHRLCPILFGIHGNMNTQQGLVRLGLEKFGRAEGNQNDYAQLMTAIGAGYTALSLRQFSGKNPAIPMSEYWRAVVSICNTPADALYPGHFFCLKGLLRDHAVRFMTFYGAPAKAVLRRATRDLPNRARPDRPGVKEAAGLVSVLPDGWKMKDGISLD